ncbi:cytochrome P450 [Favolaschia claudopus]|uniref:Cytochrome P450 n=1 Tax=Favolaschia claudopus TaxID=2862362 RepID=A0AAW0CIJ7_9AGAR
MDRIQTAVSAGLLVSVVVIFWLNRRSKGPQIPGPPAHPLVGHTFRVPKVKTWKYFEDLWHQYGSIVKVTLAGDDIVVLSDPADAEELLGRRSKIYSSRRPLVYAGKYLSNNMRLTLLPYGENLKRQRAAFHSMLQPRVIGGYEEVQYKTSLQLLLAEDGKDLAAVQKVLMDFVTAANPGAHLVDTFPVLDWLPDIVSAWRKEAKKGHEETLDLYGRLARNVKARMEADPELECFTARLWEQKEKMNLTDEELYYISGSAYAAGTDTSSITLLWFVMAMALYPEAQKKAQAEVDSFFDAHTLPNFERMKDMPYVLALIKEVIRWSPIAPLSFPHYLDADDYYKGYFIKKGTTVISSLWNMHHTEEEYPDSYNFVPERFLSKERGPEDPADSISEGIYGFGFGRRRCPGQHLAAKSTWIVVVRTLWAFRIEPGKDANGNPVKLDVDDCTNGLTSRPHKFPCDFIPRSATHLETIMGGEGRS